MKSSDKNLNVYVLPFLFIALTVIEKFAGLITYGEMSIIIAILLLWKEVKILVYKPENTL
jgi:hypothetical protein